MKIDSLSFEEVTFQYEGQDPLLKNCTFDFPMNGIVWFKASEGAGKSSLLQLLAGLVSINSGKYWINELDAAQMSFEEFLPYRLSIGYSFDYGGLINNRSIFDNLTLPLLYHKMIPESEARERVTEILNHFDITKFAHERPAHVPGRVRKLACILRALVLRPEVLLMDDPSVGLGQETVYKFVDYIHQMRKDGYAKHIFLSSYDEKFMNLLDYQIVHLSDGQLYLQQIEGEKRMVAL